MVSALSSQQLSALSSLLDMNSTMSELQSRIASGKKINSIFDGATQFLQAQTMNTRSASLLDVNKQIDLSVSAVSMAQKGISKLKTDFTNAISDLRALKGTKEATAATTGSKTDEVIKGVIGTTANEAAAVSTSATAMGISAAALRANKKVFGTREAASATSNGNVGMTAPTGSQVLRVEVIKANSGLTNIDRIVAVDFSSPDLTVGDIVKRLNSSTDLDALAGTGAADFTASLDADGTLRVSTTTGVNLKLRIGLTTASSTYTGTPPASVFTSGDSNTVFGLGAYNGTPTAGWATTITGASGLTAAEAVGSTAIVAPPSIATQLLATSRKILDNDTVATNNGATWDSTATGGGAISSGNYGVKSGNTLAIAVTENGTKSYLTFSEFSSTSTVDDLVTAFNAKAHDAGLSTRAVMDSTKGLTFNSSPVGTAISFGQGTDATGAKSSADAGALNASFGFSATAQLAVVEAQAATDASNVSLIGTGAGKFQAGDMFSITVKSDDPARPDTRTISFKATATSPTSLSNFDGTSAKPYEFSSMEDLKRAINTGFGAVQLKANATKLADTGKGVFSSQFQLELTLNQNYSMEINQTNNVSDGAPTANGMSGGLPLLKNSANALDAIFGSASGREAGQLASTLNGATLLNNQNNYDLSGNVVSRQENYGAKITYSRIADTAKTDGDAKRASTSQSIAKMLSLIVNSVETAAVPGQPNILKGATLTTKLLDDGDAKLDIGLSESISAVNLGFTMDGTDFSILTSKLGKDADVDTAINTIQSAIDALDSHATTLASSASLLTSSKTFNEGMSKVLTEAATNLTASNTTQDSAEMQAMSTRYQLATAALGLLNQSTQMAAQMLR